MTLTPFVLPLFFFVINAGPTLFLLIFLNRRVRAIGPMLLILMVVVCIGAEAATMGASSYAGLKVMSRLATFGSDSSVSALWVLAGFTLVIVRLLGMLLFLPLGWLAIVWLRRRYDAKRFSEETLVF